MPIRNIYWIGAAVALVGLGVLAVTQQATSPSLQAAEAGTGQLTRPHASVSAASTPRTPDLRAELAVTVHFASDQWLIQPMDTEILDAKIAILEANPNVRIRIIGHSDERGGEIYNLALGRRRADAAKTYLVKHGVDASRIETVSAGEGQPVDPRHLKEAWARNRRDEFKLVAREESFGLQPSNND